MSFNPANGILIHKLPKPSHIKYEPAKTIRILPCNTDEEWAEAVRILREESGK